MAKIEEEVEELRTAVAVLQTEHRALAERFETHERKQNGSLDKIWTKLDEMSKGIAAAAQVAATPKGPSWGVSTAITALVGLSSALIVYTVTH